jgi:hypothetical protein
VYARVNLLTGDPARLGEAVRYAGGIVRPHVEAQQGNRGLACMVNSDLGICVVASYWDTLEAMTWSEHAVHVFRKQVVERLHGTAAVEHYQVPVFVRRSRPQDGAAVRLTRLESVTAGIDRVIEEFRSTALPALLDTPTMCSAHIMTDRTLGRCLVATTWESTGAMGASRSATAGLRADMVTQAQMQVRSVEEYKMVFSSVRDGIALEVGVWVTPSAAEDGGPDGQWKLPDKVTYWVL